MVNTGKPSSGCFSCRRARVKCDEVRPFCTRCQRLGLACEGYPLKTNVKFKDETRKTITRATRSSRVACVPTPGPSIPSIDQSLSLFLADHVVATPDGSTPGYLDYLPAMYSKAKPGSCLQQTVRAIALTHLYNQGGSAFEVKCSARRYYGDALTTINEALNDPVERLADGTILSIWLMQLYEVITGELKHVVEDEPAWTSHIQGLVMLLHLRGTDQLRTRRECRVFYLVHGSAMMYALMAGKKFPLDDWQPLLEQVGKASAEGPSSGALTSSFRAQVADVCAQMRSFCMDPSSVTTDEQTNVYTQASALRDRALCLQKSALDWPRDELKGQQRLKRYPDMLPGGAQHSRLDSGCVHDRNSLRLRSMLHGVVIVLHETLLHFECRYRTSFLESSSPALLSDTERTRCVDIVVTTADQILNTMPFLFGEVDSSGAPVQGATDVGWKWRSRQAHMGGPAIWYLRMIKMSGHTSRTQKGRATEGLLKIGRRMGIRQALTIAAA